MNIQDFLDKSGVDYELTEHSPAFSAQRMAAAEHEHGKYVAKPVIVKVGGEYVMCVLAASSKIDMGALKEQLGAESVELAEEKEISEIFKDCQLGAEPPFGNLYNITTILDSHLKKDDHIVFQAGTHDKAIRMSTKDYVKLVNPKVLKFSYHTAS